MTEAKDIPADDSLNYLRAFDKNAESRSLAALVREKLSHDKTILNLHAIALTEADFQSLAEWVPVVGLKQLNLNRTGLNSVGMKHLCGGSAFGELGVLELADNNLDDEAAFYISKASAFPNVAVLKIAANEIGDEGAMFLARSPNLANLESSTSPAIASPRPARPH
jgi:hypothetical protein